MDTSRRRFGGGDCPGKATHPFNRAAFFNGAKLLVAADCTGYAYANFHQEFMRGKVTISNAPSLTLWHYLPPGKLRFPVILSSSIR